MGCSASCDFTYDDISTPDAESVINPLLNNSYKNQLIVDDMEDYYTKYFNK